MSPRRWSEANSTDASVTILSATAETPETPFKFVWQRAVCSKECPLAPTVRLVALARSIHMDADGTNCYAGAGRIADETGLHLRTVREADKALVAGGWLVVTFQGGSPRGGARLATVYRAQIPTTGGTGPLVTGGTGPLVRQPTGGPESTTGGTGPPHHVLPRKSKTRAPGTPSADDLGADFSKAKNGKTAERDGTIFEDPFVRFYAVFPRRVAREAARKAFAKALKTVTVEELVAGAERYRDDPDRDPRYTAYPATWLNAGRWADERPSANGKASDPYAEQKVTYK